MKRVKNHTLHKPRASVVKRPSLLKGLTAENIINTAKTPSQELLLSSQEPLIDLSKANYHFLDSSIENDHNHYYNGVLIPGTNKLLLRCDKDGDISKSSLVTAEVENNRLKNIIPFALDIDEWVQDLKRKGVEDPRIYTLRFNVGNQQITKHFLVTVNTNFFPSATMKPLMGATNVYLECEYREIIQEVEIVDDNLRLLTSPPVIRGIIGQKGYSAKTIKKGDKTMIEHTFRVREETGARLSDGRQLIQSAMYAIETNTMEELTEKLIKNTINNKKPIVERVGVEWFGHGPGKTIHYGGYENKRRSDDSLIPDYRRYIVIGTDGTYNHMRLLIDPAQLPHVGTKHESLLVFYPKDIVIVHGPNGKKTYIYYGGYNDIKPIAICVNEDNPGTKDAYAYFNKEDDSIYTQNSYKNAVYMHPDFFSE
jgi:hypothetical protein